MARTGIKDGRPQGPQKNKWGYVNNPRWKVTPMGPLSYDGRESEEPQVWDTKQAKFSNGDIKTHIPCGHWHKPTGEEGGGNGENPVYQIYITGDNNGNIEIFNSNWTLLYSYVIPDYSGKVIYGTEVDEDGYVYVGSRSSPYQINTLSPILALIDTYESPGLCEDDTELQQTQDIIVDISRMKLYAGGQTCYSSQPALHIFTLDIGRNLTVEKIVTLEAAPGGLVFALCQDDTYIYCGTADASGKIYRFNKSTEVVTTWTILIGMNFDESCFEINDGYLYAGGYTSVPNILRLYKIDTSTGNILASYIHGETSYTKGIFFTDDYVYLTSYAYHIFILRLNKSDLTLSLSGNDVSVNAAFNYDPNLLIGYYAEYGYHKYTVGEFNLTDLTDNGITHIINFDYITNINVVEKTWT